MAAEKERIQRAVVRLEAYAVSQGYESAGCDDSNTTSRLTSITAFLEALAPAPDADVPEDADQETLPSTGAAKESRGKAAKKKAERKETSKETKKKKGCIVV